MARTKKVSSPSIADVVRAEEVESTDFLIKQAPADAVVQHVADSTSAPWDVGMNTEQLAAIYHDEGPCMLLAGAGSGKTRALVHRTARLVHARKIPEARILNVTFSKKAAEEMNTRLGKLDVHTARVGTWHSLCLEIISKGGTEWSDWKVDDKGRAKLLLKQALGHQFMNWKGVDVGRITSYIGRCKANLWAPGDVEAMEQAILEFGRADCQRASEAYQLSQRMIEDAGLLTFDDMLVFTHRHLSDEDNRLEWAARWDYVVQDEAQDANRAQVEIAKQLSKDHRNYMVVGDIAQAIYSFRGSKPDYLAKFGDEWTNAKQISMMRNYRSGSSIVTAANAVIRPAAMKMPEDMVAERPDAGSARAVQSTNYDAAAQDFVAWVKNHMNEGLPLTDICALFRLNSQSRSLEDALLSSKIPYVVVGGVSFYDRREVRDLLAYLRVALGRDKDDDGTEGEAIRRCINTPFRFLGKVFVERMMAAAPSLRAQGKTWVEVAREVATGERIQARQVASVETWANLIETIERMSRPGSSGGRPATAGELLTFIVTKTNFINEVEKDDGAESTELNTAANVREMMRVASEFKTGDELLDYIDETLRAAKRQRRDGQAGGERLTLMTVHKSKGLEWPKVWIVGCNDGVMPHAMGDIEEERRIAYVAMTRARDELVISHVREVATRAGVKDGRPSRFLVDAGLVS